MNYPTLSKKVFVRNLLILILIVFVLFLLSKIESWKTSNQIKTLPVSTEEARSYVLYVPKSYDPNSPAPLVITLHGYTSNPTEIATTSRWNDLAEEEGFIVVYPLGSGHQTYWQTSGTPYYGRKADMDVLFISSTIDEIEAKYKIDPARIYVNGHSMGGGMSHVLACKLADRVAAIGSVAGAYAYPTDLCNPSRPVPFIAFHGTADNTVPYDGELDSAYGGTFPSIPLFMENWSKRNQCSETTTIPVEGEISSVSYTKCVQNADVVFYTIVGGGHTWPGDPSDPNSVLGYTTQQIDASRLMWEFFKQHPLPAD